MFYKAWYVLLFSCSLDFVLAQQKKPPHIILIIADDLGWNDIGFHGSNEIPTPNVDALAYNGVILNRHYVLPTCTPSRVALMTGKYPIRTGLQGDPGSGPAPWALSAEEKILPQYLKDYGYKTHLVGKWHLGFYQTKYTPTYRGFDTHFGYYNGWLSYNDSTVSSTNMRGFDARRNLKHAADEFVNRYVTDVFTDEAVKIIRDHDRQHPLFLKIGHAAVHAMKGDIVQVRNEAENDEKFSYIADKHRRLFAGALNALDDSVGAIMEALHDTQLLDNSIVLFMSDNGGATVDPDWKFKNTASNWPLRGMKTSLYEGGIRGVTAIWSPLFKKKNHVSNELFHITDWLPTFLSAAGGSAEDLQLDGIDQWDYLLGRKANSDRNEILLNINHERSNAAYIKNNWKIITCNETYQPTFADEYDGITGRETNDNDNLNLVLDSITNKIISEFAPINNTAELFSGIRKTATIDERCESRINADKLLALPCIGDRLYDIEKDPCEYTNVADENTKIVQTLKNRLNYFETKTVKNIREASDVRANPIYWNNYWSPWLDENLENLACSVIYSMVFVISAFLYVLVLKR